MTSIELLSGYARPREVADALGVTIRTLSRYESQPNGVPSVLIGGRKWFRLASVRAWIEAHERRANPRRGAK